MDIEIFSHGGDRTGPLVFSYPFPFDPIPRHRAAFSTKVTDWARHGSADFLAQYRDKHLRKIDSRLEDFVSYFSTLQPTRLTVLDSNVHVDPIVESSSRSDDPILSAIFGGIGFPDDSISEAFEESLHDEAKSYEQLYAEKLEEIRREGTPSTPLKLVSSVALKTSVDPWRLVFRARVADDTSLEKIDFPLRDFPEVYDFFKFFGDLSHVHGDKNLSGCAFASHNDTWLVNSGDSEWGTFDQQWEGAIPLIWTACGDCLVLSKSGSIGKFFHEFTCSPKGCISETPLRDFKELLSAFVTYCEAPDHAQDSYFW